MASRAFLEMARETIKIILLMVAPVLSVSLLVGLAVNVFQAATQIQEQTLTFVPKIVAVLLVLMLLGGWIMDMAVRFTQELWGSGMIPY